jgi:hypothetical protein
MRHSTREIFVDATTTLMLGENHNIPPLTQNDLLKVDNYGKNGVQVQNMPVT